MLSKIKKPYVIYMAEIIYSYVSIIKKKYPEIDIKIAINKFMETDQFKRLRNGTLHDEWFNELKKNNYIDKKSGVRIPEETIKLLEIQRDITVKQLINTPALYETRSNTQTDPCNHAYQFLWRMCESYELWCNETGQSKELILKIID